MPKRPIQSRKSYGFFKEVHNQLIALGIDKLTAAKTLRIIHNAIDAQRGYHYAHLAYAAGESVECLIREIEDSELASKIPVKRNLVSESPRFTDQAG
jgi:hypothetical protein